MSKSGFYADRAKKLFKLVFEILTENEGSLSREEIFQVLQQRSQLDERDRELGEKSGVPRWLAFMTFYSLWAKDAGFLRQNQGIWTLTAEGMKAAELPANALMEAIRRSRTRRKAKHPLEGEQEPEVSEGAVPLAIAYARSQARNEINRYIDNLEPYDFQDLVAALLRGMGYHIRHVAPPGKDGGTDILACRDPLGVEQPHIRVQVKHQAAPVGRGEIAKLRGDVRSNFEIGLFVSSSGFSKDAVAEAKRGDVHIELMDPSRLLTLWIEHWGSLSEEDRARLRLTPVHFLALDE